MHLFARPLNPTLDAAKQAVTRPCPSCHSTSAAKYQVLSEGGWWDVVKCVDCLRSHERSRAPRLGAFSPMVSRPAPTECAIEPAEKAVR